ncbi:toxin HipA [Spirochaetia bacterium]|nr:toxin HipA [Spirochaetia bacterium]
MSGDIYAYLDMADAAEPVHIGVLHGDIIRGKEVFSFTGSTEWLEHREFHILDPDLGPFAGRQYLRDGKPNFGLFLDSAPDRWGRMLIKRREAVLARQEARPPKTLYETDYLLNLYDGSRMGALRLKLDPDGDFLDNNADLAVPPWDSIRDLEHASRELERDDTDDAEYSKWLNMLVRPGSSLGGARPKATVTDRDGHLWIAKFPSGHDSKDVGAWEQVVNELAADCGITVPRSAARCFTGRQHTFLSERFDRIADKRLHFASAMTLLGKQDGADAFEGTGYLDMAEILIRHGADVDRNLEELWRRMAFNIAVSNCDDHLRNHGFILTPSGWIVSPAYDMNPDENGTGLKLNISEGDNSLDFDLALSVIAYFRLSVGKAKSILTAIKDSVSNWRAVADRYDIPRQQQDMVAPAFRT